MLQHLGEEEHLAGAVTPPIVQTSLFVMPDFETFKQRMSGQFDPENEHVYSRISNPNLAQVEIKVATLEGMDRARLFSSGMGAISAAIMSCTQAGAHVVADETVYGPTQEFLRDYLPRFGVTSTFVDTRDIAAVKAAWQPETTLLYLESPGSILFRLQDLTALSAFAHEKGAMVAMDNSYSAGLIQQPSRFGVDIVVHSATKYLCGHSDVVAGALACNEEHYAKLMVGEVALIGATLAPFNAWLMLRGMRTLGLRMAQAEKVGNAMAAFLRQHPRVTAVNHVDDQHPQADLWRKQMTGSGGLLSFEIQDPTEDRMHAFADTLELFQLGVSWGGFESLCVPIHLKLPSWTEPQWVIRLYCGLEDPADLIQDVERGLAAAY